MWLVPFFCEFNLSGILGFFVAPDLLDEALALKRPFGQPAGPASEGRSVLASWSRFLQITFPRDVAEVKCKRSLGALYRYHYRYHS